MIEFPRPHVQDGMQVEDFAMDRIAVLMTCHNRKEVTLRSVSAIFSSALVNVELMLFIVDAGSTDGTSESLEASPFNIKVVRASSDLYWNAGMRVAWDHAEIWNPDFYLWLNDDLELFPGAIAALLNEYLEYRASGKSKLIIVGRTICPDTGEITYGGYRHDSVTSRLTWRRLRSDERLCDTMNGNCVLVPSLAYQDIGNLSARFAHALGDIDYGIRANQAGFSVVELKAPVGNQRRNFQVYSGARVPLTLRNIQHVLIHPKGVPIQEWWYFCRTHAGVFWPINFLLRYLKVFVGSSSGGIRNA